MRNFKLSERLIKIIVSVVIVIFSAIVFEKILSNIGVIAGGVASVFGFVNNLLLPFIFGFALAYLLNPAVRFIEISFIGKLHDFFEKKRAARFFFLKSKKSHSRVTAVVVTYLLLIGFIVWIVAYLVPEIVVSSRNLIANTIAAQADFEPFGTDGFLNKILHNLYETFSVRITVQDIARFFLEPFMAGLSSVPDILETVFLGTVSVAYTVFSFLIGLIIAFYMLLEKENMGAASVKIVRTVLREPDADMVFNFAKNAHYMFERFFIGKIIESAVVALIFLIGCLFIRPPYTALLTLIIGVTNMIPYFGPWIGGAIAVVIVMIRSPVQALWIGVFVLILQQVDAVAIAPKILGDSTGLKPLDVIFAIFLGGALFGVLGMFLAVPLYAVLKNIARELIDRRYSKKYTADEDKGGPP